MVASDSITVTVDNTNDLTVKQNTVKNFTIQFDHAVKELSKDQISVSRLFTTADTTYKYPMVVNTVTLASDGKSAEVELFSAFADQQNYLITVDGFEEYTLTASCGAPSSITISSKADAISPLVTAGSETDLFYHLYDKNGVDVTTGNETVIFNVEKYSTDGSYYVAGNKIWFLQANLSANVVAEYQSGRFENGVQVGNVSTTFGFTSVESAPITFQGLAGATVTGWDKPAMDIPMGDLASLQIKIKLSDKNEPIIVNQNGQSVGVGSITFESVNQDNLILNLSDLSLILCKEGPATVIVNLETTDLNGNITKTPVGMVTVNIKPRRALQSARVDKPVITIGSTDGFDTETIKFTAVDQYGAEVPVTSLTLSGANAIAESVIGALTVNGNAVTLDGSELAAAITSGTAIQLTFKARVNNSHDVAFSVLVKKDTGVTASNYVLLESSAGAMIDIARTVDSKDGKSVTFKAYVMNNGIKVGEQAVAPYPVSPSIEDEGKYFFRVMRNGVDITSQVTAISNGAQINFSTTEETSIGAVTGSVVNYNLGAGNYSFNLYKCIKSGTSQNPIAVLVQQQVANVVATCNTGSYSAAVRTSETVKEDLRQCFSIKDTKGNEAATPYYTVNVDEASLSAGSPYVFVKSIDFYDDLGNGEFAKYTVNIGVSLKK